MQAFLRNQFLPAPIPLVRTETGLRISESIDKGHFFDLSTRIASEFLLENLSKCFDKYCPSVQATIHEGTCNKCGRYFVTKYRLVEHKRFHKYKNLMHIVDQQNDEIVEMEVTGAEDDKILFINDMEEWLTCPFSSE